MNGWEDVTPDDETVSGFDPTVSAGIPAPPAYPAQPTYPTQPAQPTYPAQPTQPAQPAQPAYPATSDSPFGGVEAVDGIVYAAQETSPELNWRPTDHAIPAPPVRERPAPRRQQRAEPWKPGPDPVPVSVRANRTRVARMVLLSVIPIAVLLGLGYLVWTFMKAYGL